jgi:hypothetical protein
MDERGCPPQILLGTCDPDFCVLLHLALHVEYWIESGNACASRDSAFLFTNDANPETGPASANRWYQDTLRKIYECAAFLVVMAQVGGKLGIHSLRKFAATFARAMGQHCEDVDVRGRWKSKPGENGNFNKVVKTVYVSPDQPFIDANVAATLCLGSPIAYRKHPDAASWLTDQMLLEHVVPHTHAFFGSTSNPSLVLALPLLWACFDGSQKGKMDAWQRQRVREIVFQLKPDDWPMAKNPIVKDNVVVVESKI